METTIYSELNRIKELGDIVCARQPVIYNVCQITSHKYPFYVGSFENGHRPVHSLKERRDARRELKRLYRCSSDEDARRTAREQIKRTNWLRRSNQKTSFTEQWLNESPTGQVVSLVGIIALMDAVILSGAALIYKVID